MIITKTPFRMSFFGGGTDIPDFFEEYGGSVLSTTFNKYCYVNIRHLPQFFDYSSELVYSKLERVTHINQIEHPMIREAMHYFDINQIRLTYEGDLPARTGLGTSSSFAVGMINAFYAFKGKHISKKALADNAILLERELCHELGGWQDQIAAAWGGINRIDFCKDRSYSVKPVVIDEQRKQQLNDSLVLFFTGFTRLSSEIQKKTQVGYEKNKMYLLEMKNIVDTAVKVLTDKKKCLDEFGYLLDETWKLKRQISSHISNTIIDKMYQQAKDGGAIGGKILGAGGGGFLLLYVPVNRKKILMEKMREYKMVPFRFENEGSKVIYCTADSEI